MNHEPGPCNLMHPFRNSSKSIEPLWLMSSISNRNFASLGSMSKSRKNARTSLSSLGPVTPRLQRKLQALC